MIQKKVYTYDFNDKKWTAKAPMSFGRSSFGCAMFKNKSNENEIKIAAVGGDTKTVEFYDLQSDTWTKGK